MNPLTDFMEVFTDSYLMTGISAKKILIALIVTTLMSLYIFVCYRFFVKRTFYSRSFNISLVAMALTTAAIILTVQQSIVMSLGMVGALSIVRFRTAVKEPMDLAFLYWSIGTGIMCGAGWIKIALLAMIFISLMLLILSYLPSVRTPKILTINASPDDGLSEAVREVVTKHCRHYEILTESVSDKTFDMVIELNVQEGSPLIRELKALNGVTSATLLSHSRDVTV